MNYSWYFLDFIQKKVFIGLFDNYGTGVFDL